MTLSATQRDRARDYVAATRSVLRDVGGRDEVDDLDALLAVRRADVPTVAVIGEPGVGKSALISALVQRTADDAAPIDADLCTGSFVSYVRGPDPEPMVIDACGRRQDWRSWSRSVLADPTAIGVVPSVEVRVRSTMLERVSLVDTPGLSSYSGPASELVLELVDRVDAVLFVTDAGAALTAAALDFLASVSARVQDCAVVINKIDDFYGWERIRRDDCDLLRQRGELSSCPVLPIAAAIHLLALRSGTQDLPTESRITALFSYLQTVSQRLDVLRTANTVRAAMVATAITQDRFAERKAALSPQRGSSALEDAQRRLRSLSSETSRQLTQLDREMRAITLDHTEGLRRGMQELQWGYTEQAETCRPKDVDALANGLLTDVQRFLLRLSGDVESRLGVLVTALLGEIDADSDLGTALARVSDHRLHTGTDHRDAAGGRAMAMSERLSLVSSFSSGRSIASSALPMLAGGAPLGLGLPFGLGAVFAGLSAHARRSALVQQELRGWIREQLQAVQADASSAFARSLHDLQSELREVVNDAAARRTADLNQLVESLRNSNDQARTAVDRERSALADQLRTLRTHHDRGRQLLTALTAAPTKGRTS